MIGEVGGRLGHVAAVAGRADAAALAGEGHDESLAAARAPGAGEAEAEDPAGEIAAEFVLDIAWHGPLGSFPPFEPALEVLGDDLVERRLLGPASLVTTGFREASVWAEAASRGKPCNRGDHGRTGRWKAGVNSRTLSAGRAVRHQPIARLGGRANKAGACRGGSCIPIPENVVVAWNHESSGPKARAFSQSSYVTRAASMYLAIWRLSGVDGVSRIESVAAGRMTERLRFNRYTSQKIPQTPALPAFSPPPPDEAEPCGHATDSEHAHGRRLRDGGNREGDGVPGRILDLSGARSSGTENSATGANRFRLAFNAKA